MKLFVSIFCCLFFLTSNSLAINEAIYEYRYDVFPLQGELNDTPVFNSNSPEEVITQGILLSTFSKENKEYPNAHIDYKFINKFDIFSHHIAVKTEENKNKTLFQGILVKNLSNEVATIKIHSSATYLTSQTPFLKLDDYIINNDGAIFAGPGDKVNQDILRNKNYFVIKEIKIKPKSYYILFNEPINIKKGATRNARTCLFKLETDKNLYISDLAIYQDTSSYENLNEKPSIDDYIYILEKNNLAQKRDKVPTPIDKPYKDKFFYSRVSGIAHGNTWKAKIINEKNYLKIPEKNFGYSYVLNSVYNNTYGTKNVQSAKVVKRYNDTAYQSHGNYGVTYEIEFNLYNYFDKYNSISINFSSPIRTQDDVFERTVRYFEMPEEKIKFRGEIKISYTTTSGIYFEKYIHLVQRFGQDSSPIGSFLLAPNEKRKVKIKYIYPADCTPPHILSIYNM